MGPKYWEYHAYMYDMVALFALLMFLYCMQLVAVTMHFPVETLRQLLSFTTILLFIPTHILCKNIIFESFCSCGPIHVLSSMLLLYAFVLVVIQLVIAETSMTIIMDVSVTQTFLCTEEVYTGLVQIFTTTAQVKVNWLV